MKITAYINDSAEELLLNLVAQDFFSEAWELKMKLMIAFEDSLDKLMIKSLSLNSRKIK
jgi:hypothetical protein